MAAGRQARSPRQAVGVMTLCAMVMVLAACGPKGDKPATQAAAKVNKEEVTVHQINYVLRQQRGVPPAQAASASRQVLERLIDQEVAVQKAKEQSLDRDPNVVQQIEAARREIIARAYVDRIGSGASKPTPEEIKQYYEEKPALFKERRIYTLQEIRIEATPDQVTGLRAKLEAAAGVNDFLAYLKSAGLKFTSNQNTLAAEQLPLARLPAIAAMKDGQSAFEPMPDGAQVLVLLSSRAEPVDEERAAPAIEMFLLNERRRSLIEADLKALRGEAKIEYLGDYAKPAAAPASAP
ncbi:MAG: EpsD family peptidyl-prolyl cis-trans isomerase [Rhizobacter sp.]|nr:EpsD family peptidyl-prolyl cis-trans isomerase [Rhizobacter sp.]